MCAVVPLAKFAIEVKIFSTFSVTKIESLFSFVHVKLKDDIVWD